MMNIGILYSGAFVNVTLVGVGNLERPKCLAVSLLLSEKKKKHYAYGDETPDTDGNNTFDPPNLGGTLWSVLGASISSINS
jgi:hypothetical protein